MLQTEEAPAPRAHCSNMARVAADATKLCMLCSLMLYAVSSLVILHGDGLVRVGSRKACH